MSAAKIMIVEDEILVAMELRERLKDLGYIVPAVVAYGEVAIEEAGKHEPNLVLMDIVLAGEVDGIEAAAKIRDLYDIPVIFLTAHSDEATLRKAKLSEPFGYLIKPFTESELRTSIEVALYKHSQESKQKRTSDWFSKTISALGGAIIVTDPDGVILQINALAEVLTGWTKDEALGKDMKQVLVLTDIDAGEHVCSVLPAPWEDGPPVTSCRSILKARNGLDIPIEHSVLPLESASGEVENLVFSFREYADSEDGKRDWFSYAANLRMTAAVSRSGGEYALAESYYRRALAFLEEHLGADNPKLASILEDLAEVYRYVGKQKDAEILALRVARLGSERKSKGARSGQRQVSRYRQATD
jgi:PAS domain S-box-containing protein